MKDIEYYTRFTITKHCLNANVLFKSKTENFKYRNQILKRDRFPALCTVFYNGIAFELLCNILMLKEK